MKYFFLISAILLGLISSCTPKQNMVYMSNDNFKNEISQAKYNGLHIQDGDVLEIVVSALDDFATKPFNKTSMSQTGTEGIQVSRLGDNEYIVNDEGNIVFPVIGTIYCRGMSKEQLRGDLEKRLKLYITDPLVSIKLTNFNISVLGDVKSPGQKTSTTEKLNIFQALALGGDLNDSANRTNIKLIRYSEEIGKDVVTSLDLSEASVVNSPYYYVQQNDIIYVEPDKNKQISANMTNPNRNLALQIAGVVMGLVTFIIAITK